MKNRKLGVIALIVLFAVLMAGAAALYAALTAEPAAQEPAPTAYAAAVTMAPQQEEPAAAPEPQEAAGPQPKENLAPVFTVYEDDGTPVRLSDLRGKPVIVNFFASWCGPCRLEMPHFDEAYAAYGDQIHFMMVDLCAYGNDTKENAKALVAEGGWTFPVYYDTDGSAATAYAVRSMPTTIFVTADGELASGRIGAMTQQQLQQEIDALLSK